MAGRWTQESKEERELFGSRRLTDEEFEIVFDFDLTHEQKMEKLTAIRAAKAEKMGRRRTESSRKRPALAKVIVMTKTFPERVTAGDSIRAHGMGFNWTD